MKTKYDMNFNATYVPIMYFVSINTPDQKRQIPNINYCVKSNFQ